MCYAPWLVRNEYRKENAIGGTMCDDWCISFWCVCCGFGLQQMIAEIGEDEYKFFYVEKQDWTQVFEDTKTAIVELCGSKKIDAGG